MKTAISVPDDVFHEVDKVARERHSSRSEIIVSALREYLERRRSGDLLKALNEAYAAAETPKEYEVRQKAKKRYSRSPEEGGTMKRLCLVIMLVLPALLAPLPAGAAGSTLTEKEAPTLSEDRLAGVIRNEHCIILYYDPVAESRDDEAWSRFQATPQQLADRLMKAMMAMADRVQASGKFYKVNSKGFSPDAIARILADTGTVQKRPESPSIVTYVLNRPIAYRFRGTARPDMLPWFVHEVMGYFIYAVKTDKGDFLRGGWTFTDTNASFISLAGAGKESREFNGRTETVQVYKFVSRPYEGFACEYERIYSSDGRLLASIENYGKNGKFGYFDYDRSGTMQYRVKYTTPEPAP